jgi:hypothetical protein
MDLATVTGTFQTLALTTTTNITLATSNRAAGRYMKLLITNTSGSQRTINWSGLTTVGPILPTTIDNGGKIIVDVLCAGTGVGDVAVMAGGSLA